MKAQGFILNFFKPSIYVRSFQDVNITQLKKQGIKLFISDLDNTLAPLYKKMPNRKVIKFIEKIESAGIKFVILSNNIKSRVKKFAEKANVDEWYHNARKPFKFVIKKIFNKHKLKPSEVIIMGDQIIMDILVANRLKCESILVQPLILNDYKMNSFNHFLENRIYKNLEKNNILKPSDFIKSKIIDKNQLL